MRWTRVWMLSLPGIWQANHRPIIQTNSALFGDLYNSGGTAAGVGLCLWGTCATHCGDGGANSWKIRLTSVLFSAQFWGAYLGSCGWNSYRLGAMTLKKKESEMGICHC